LERTGTIEIGEQGRAEMKGDGAHWPGLGVVLARRRAVAQNVTTTLM